MDRIKVLVVDDESRMRKLVRDFLEREGFRVLEAKDGVEAMEFFYSDKEIALLILDVMMPNMDGWQVCREVRQTSDVPIIMLTAKGEDADKVLGLTVGADDYVTKPFQPVELLARVKSQLRRYMMLGGSLPKPENLSIGGIELDDKAKEVMLDGEKVPLTPTEFDILKLFMQHPGEVFSPAKIYSEVWKDNPYGTENTVAVHIRHLREKLEINPAEPRYLKVVWGHGYKLEAPGERR